MSSMAVDAPEVPPRPAIPVTFWMLATVVAVTRAVLRYEDELPLCIVAVGVSLAAAFFDRMRGTDSSKVHPFVFALAAAALVSALTGSLELARQADLQSSLGSSAVSGWTFTIEGEMSLGSTGWRGRATAQKDGRAHGMVWIIAKDELPIGSTISCVGRYEGNGSDEWAESSRMQGIAGTVEVVRVLSQADAAGLRGLILMLRNKVLDSFDAGSSESRAVLAGSVCGTSRYIDELGIEPAFVACGVSHLIAVSGGHLVVVAAVIETILSHAHKRPLTRSVIALVVSAAFVVFCAAPLSAVRSLAMLGVSSLAQAAGRRGHPLSSVSVVALAMAVLEPGVTGQLGYLLSVVCVCGIALFGGYARYAVRALVPDLRGALLKAPGGFGRRLASAADAVGESLALTFVSQVVTMPITLPVFGQLSLVAPIANVVLAPLFSTLLTLGLLAASLVWAPPLQAVVLWISDVVGSVFVAALKLLAGVPLASVAVTVEEAPALAVLVFLSAALLVAWPRVNRRVVLAVLTSACAAGLAWVVRWRYFAPACVHALDVGQGDAILVTDGASALLVDTGPGDSVVEALARNHVYHLDAVLLTHLHDDHVGGLDDLQETVRVDKILVADGVSWDGEGVPVESLSYGDSLSVGAFAFEVVSPVTEVDGTENEHSIELVFSYDIDGKSLTGLLTGDGEDDVTAAAVERGDVGDVDFLKVGHHGSAASIELRTAEALDPEVSVASAGEGNSYGHPTDECVQTLEAAGSAFLCTKDVGDVTISPGSDGLVVSIQRSGS